MQDVGGDIKKLAGWYNIVSKHLLFTEAETTPETETEAVAPEAPDSETQNQPE